MNYRAAVCFLVLVCCGISGTLCGAESLAPGAGHFLFLDGPKDDQHKITVWYYLPTDFKADGNVVFVMHGVNRNGDDYRDNWIELAQKKNFLILAPQFSDEEYPSSLRYQQGNILREDGSPNDKSEWSVTAIDRIFDHVVLQQRLKAKDYVIFGHSGGAQFVHRMALLYPEARARLVITANAGWYTMPERSIAYPYGLQNTPIDEATLKTTLKQRVIVLLGEEDTDSEHRHLRRTPEAMAQGKHRLERGQAFFAHAQSKAADLGVPFRWKLVTVPNVAHENAKMAIAAAKLIE